MNLTCAIVHTDVRIANLLEEYARQIPFFTLCGIYTHTTNALRSYYKQKAEVYFIGLNDSRTEDLSGLDFSKLLTQPTRCIFVAPDGRYAAHCFRLDALDYLVESEINFSTFFQAAGKALRWFSCQPAALTEHDLVPTSANAPTPPSDAIYIKTSNRLTRLNFDHIYYIEGWGDYVKIFSQDEDKPLISLCSLKYLENKLPDTLFIRVHRSYIVRKASIRFITPTSLYVANREIPIGEVYRNRINELVSHLEIL